MRVTAPTTPVSAARAVWTRGPSRHRDASCARGSRLGHDHIAASALAAPLLPQNDGRVHNGSTGCRGPVCHSAADPMEKIKGDEWFVWHEDDRHSQAYDVLKKETSKKIAA